MIHCRSESRFSRSSDRHRPTTPAWLRALDTTHISWVFIEPPCVYKVKKAVSVGFLDLSTLEKRHYFCQREIELNRRLSPETYLGVIPIYI
jgi:uncharacterized protein